MKEYKTGIYYEEQEKKAWELIELYIRIVIPFCGIVAGLFVIYGQIRELINSI